MSAFTLIYVFIDYPFCLLLYRKEYPLRFHSIPLTAKLVKFSFAAPCLPSTFDASNYLTTLVGASPLTLINTTLGATCYPSYPHPTKEALRWWNPLQSSHKQWMSTLLSPLQHTMPLVPNIAHLLTWHCSFIIHPSTPFNSHRNYLLNNFSFLPYLDNLTPHLSSNTLSLTTNGGAQT